MYYPVYMSITFPSIGRIPYGGGCVTEPALFALNYLLTYRADLQVGGQTLPQVPVADTLKDVLARPEHYGVSAAQARDAVERFLAQAGEALEAEGGQRGWLAKEFGLAKD